jgi:hypothetical protein
MTGDPTDGTTLEDLALQLDQLADTVGPEKTPESRFAAHAALVNESDLLRRSAREIRHHAQYRRTHQRLKIVGAGSAALFALATALVGQSSGWADHNLDVAYGLLVGGSVVAAIAGAFATYLGTVDPTAVT